MAIAVIILIIAADQITKYLVEANLEVGQSIPLIPNVLEINYLKNTGAAWGMMKGARIFFIILTILVCALILYLLIKKQYMMKPLAKYAFVLIFAGAIGNLIDRIALGYVRDMIYVSCINFPVFNIADCAVTIGACLFVLDMIINKKESFFNQLDKKEENK